MSFEASWIGSSTKGKVEKIEKLSNILKEKFILFECFNAWVSYTLGSEPYLYYSRKDLHYKLEISKNKEKSRDIDVIVHMTKRI